jgi:cell filamentation protein
MKPRNQDDDPYVYPGTTVLKNKLGITDPVKLQQAELRFALSGERQMPALSPDERGLRDAHLFLFGRLYEWAGELRTCELAKGQSLFCRARFIQQSLDTTFRELARERHLDGLEVPAFAVRAAHYHGELNAIHPFREGNGRAVRVWMVHLARRAGHELTLARIDPEAWLQASHDSMKGDTRPMASLLQSALKPTT